MLGFAACKNVVRGSDPLVPVITINKSEIKMAERIRLVVDSGCDIPKSTLDRYDIGLIPGLVVINGENQPDRRDPDVTRSIYEANALGLKNDCSTDTPPVEDIRDWLNDMGKDCDALLIQTISRTTSPFFESVNQATNGVESARCRLVDTKTTLTGQAVLALHTAGLLKKEPPMGKLARTIEQLTHQVYSYAIPADLVYVRERAAKKGVEQIPWIQANLGKWLGMTPIVESHQDKQWILGTNKGINRSLQRVIDRLETLLKQDKLASPFICASIAAGRVSDLGEFSQIERLAELAHKYNKKFIRSTMSLAGGVNLGPGSVTLAFASTVNPFTDEDL